MSVQSNADGNVQRKHQSEGIQVPALQAKPYYSTRLACTEYVITLSLYYCRQGRKYIT